jgi:hypothetical protein
VPLVEVPYSDACCRIGTSRNLVVYAWWDVPAVSQLREAGRISRAAARKHPSGTALVNLVVSGTPRFSEEVRAESARIARDSELATLGGVDVILLTGLVGVAARSFLETVNLLSRAPRPRKVFGEVPSAAAWVAGKLAAGAEAWTGAQVEAAVTEVTAGR